MKKDKDWLKQGIVKLEDCPICVDGTVKDCVACKNTKKINRRLIVNKAENIIYSFERVTRNGSYKTKSIPLDIALAEHVDILDNDIQYPTLNNKMDAIYKKRHEQ